MSIVYDQHRHRLFATDRKLCCIHAIDIASGLHYVFAGSPASAAGLVDGFGTAARFGNDMSGNALAIDNARHCLYFADTANNAIRIIDLDDRSVTTLLEISGPYAISLEPPGNRLFVSMTPSAADICVVDVGMALSDALKKKEARASVENRRMFTPHRSRLAVPPKAVVHTLRDLQDHPTDAGPKLVITKIVTTNAMAKHGRSPDPYVLVWLSEGVDPPTDVSKLPKDPKHGTHGFCVYKTPYVKNTLLPTFDLTKTPFVMPLTGRALELMQQGNLFLNVEAWDRDFLHDDFVGWSNAEVPRFSPHQMLPHHGVISLNLIDGADRETAKPAGTIDVYCEFDLRQQLQ